jgi:RHS repeat-associated protein
VVKEVLYDSFGRILGDTNPAMRVPLGFGFGLHDRDTGWVRMGWRDYDPETGRFTALDPIGYAGGDSDLYGYCVDDPVNLADPWGLFRFGERDIDHLGALRNEGLHTLTGKLTFPMAGTLLHPVLKRTDDKANTRIVHEHGFYEDGSGDDIGFGRVGIMKGEDIKDYRFDGRVYDDETMREAQKKVEKGWTSDKYSILGTPWKKKDNCQDAAEEMRKEYRRIWRDRTLKKGEEDYGR